MIKISGFTTINAEHAEHAEKMWFCEFCDFRVECRGQDGCDAAEPSGRSNAERLLIHAERAIDVGANGR